MGTLDEAAARACTLCAAQLPLDPRPVLRVRATLDGAVLDSAGPER